MGLASTSSIILPASGSVAVLGSTTRDGDKGVWGANNNTAGGYGVYGYGFYGVYGYPTNYDLGWGIYAYGDAGVEDDLYVYDNLYVYGDKGSVVSVSQGYVSLAAIESPERWFEDLGTAALVDGVAVVVLEPLFAETVNLEKGYHVFLTPLSEKPVLLFVTAKTPKAFTVQGVTLAGQPATCSFDYRIVAKRLGYEELRLEPVPMKGQVQPDKVTVQPLSLQQVPQPDLDDPEPKQ